jgi:hypothetical protein
MDRRLGEDHLDGGLRVSSVTVDDCDERPIRCQLEAEFSDVLREEVAKASERAVELLQEVADLGTGVLFGLKTLRGVGEEELVGFFEGIGAYG